ncbi:MAG: sugar kinase, partial [Lentisphaeria bacterium]|nr:sugar kinase [Lentisphaeria bacterium]
MLQLKKDAAYALLVPTSMGVRLTPADGQPFHCSDTFKMQVTSAETNVASIASYLGLPVKVLTAFVKGSPVARMIKDNLAARHMAYEGPEIEQGGPWGYRHQFNLADSGCGSRGPRVQNDRAGEVGRLLSTQYFDLERIFGTEGVQIVHLSGLIAAMSEDTSRFCLEIARTAKKYGTLISFDLNYRASFWKDREAELSATFAEIAGLADILIGNEEDFQLCLKIQGPEAGGKGIADKIDSFKEMVTRVKAAYPNATAFATTLRQVVHANEHLWGAIANVNGEWQVVEPRTIAVLDRIGGGDGFVGG